MFKLMKFDSLLHKIPEIKAADLKAESAHQIMASSERYRQMDVAEDVKRNARRSAVMMLLYPKENQTYMVLIERAHYKGMHASQIALPGGKWELEDANLQITALRETEEEIGVQADKIEVIKSFSEIYIPPSNFLVAPYLGIVYQKPLFIPDEKEVAQIIEFPLQALLDENLVQQVEKQTSYMGKTLVPAYVYKEHKVWGATAMMLSELKEIMKPLFQNRKTKD